MNFTITRRDMQSFIDYYIEKHAPKLDDLQHYTFVLPSRRAIGFFKRRLLMHFNGPFLMPTIFSIEDFIEEIAEVQIIDSLKTSFAFFEVYQDLTPPNKQETFDVVYNWSQSLLGDFNEIDRFNIDASQFFGNLKAIKEIERFGGNNATELVKNYYEFWNQLPTYYQGLKENLTKKNQAYQGMAYQLALQNFPTYLKANPAHIHFIGFNALNQCEQEIFKTAMQDQKAELFWDIDQYFWENNNFPVHTFMQQHQERWLSKLGRNIQASSNLFVQKKAISIVGTPRKVGQVKFVGQILNELNQEELGKTAIVLADENLLQPLLNAIPDHIKEVNITMGQALGQTPLASFFEILLKIHQQDQTQLFYKDVLQLLAHPILKQAFSKDFQIVETHFKKENVLVISSKELLQLSAKTSAAYQKLIRLLFNQLATSPASFLKMTTDVCLFLKAFQQENKLQLAYLFSFYSLFQKLINLTEEHDYIDNLGSLKQIYQDALQSETLDFKGYPDRGLQIMGVLETRVLDFENLIFIGVNEGVLPAGKSQNSFIPFDLKIHYNLPTYKEKDAIYAYHFFRLLQRAKNIYITYNNDSSGMEKSEASRFIKQLEIYTQEIHALSHRVMGMQAKVHPKKLQQVEKSPAIINQLKDLFAHGISPSALTTYIRNPIDFYQKYVLKIRESEEIEEEVSYRVYGNVVHQTLENLYKNYIGKHITAEVVQSIQKNLDQELLLQFQKQFNEEAIFRGKNLLVFEMAKNQCQRFLKNELKLVEKSEVKLVSLEEKAQINFQIKGLNTQLQLRGTADRIDQVDGVFRIIDYKTGNVQATDLRISDFDLLIEDFKKSKVFQVLFYSLIMENKLQGEIKSGIISFKNLKEGFMNYELKSGRKTLSDSFDEHTKTTFTTLLKSLICEILNPEIPFTEKEL